MISGLVDEKDFDRERQGRTAKDLFIDLLANVPPDEDLVSRMAISVCRMSFLKTEI